ncbi:methyltransferase [Agromyces kandeliae]|uniref:Methyltransferase domain-containing protein n=1 Tax=Agromyces kandeliae TaxID=2666141 RepID=A0A6L5R0X9_9MICO|nr:methyltransferase [Agromyces kandeliae]MRX43612.1 methyltransferase domain-containing protein [Agromyces kandeliae]
MPGADAGGPGLLHALATLDHRDVDARELMDDPAADPEALERTFHRFGVVNRIVSRPAAVYEEWVRPRLATTHRARLLDIGVGGGDLPHRILQLAERDGLRLEVVAIDPDDRAVSAASRFATSGFRTRVATTADLVAEGETFDVVWSNHVLHHLGAAELGALLADTERLVAPGGIGVHGDIERSRGAYLGFWAATLPFAWNVLAGSFIRPDGLTSIRRSHTAPELARAIPRGWRVKRGFPSRLELVWGSEIPDE